MKYRSRHVERMALIESGQSANIFSDKTYSSADQSLKNGLFLIGGGMGFIGGRILESVMGWGEGSGAIATASIGAGIGLVIFYQIMRSKQD